MRSLPLVLLGYGPVMRDLVDLIDERRDELRRRYGLDVAIAGIRARHRQVLPPAGNGDGIPPRDAWRGAGDLASFLAATGASIAVQAIPSAPSLVDIATEQVLTAFDAGMDVVTATKSHLVGRWAQIAESATARGRRIRISAATGAALPAADLARVSLRGFPVRSIRGSLNGTSSFVLEQLAAGASLPEAISHAQARGIAEADPTNDLNGYDNASKLVLLANLVWSARASLSDVEREPIDGAAAVRAQAAERAGRRLRAVATADGAVGRLSVGLVELQPDDPLFALRGPEKAVVYDCEPVGQILVAGGKSSPRGAAQAMLKDILGLGLEAGTAGFS